MGKHGFLKTHWHKKFKVQFEDEHNWVHIVLRRDPHKGTERSRRIACTKWNRVKTGTK